MKNLLCPGFIFALILMTILPGVAIAGDASWQILWRDDGSLQEEVRISGHDIVLEDTNWQESREGDQYIFHREVKNWSAYQELKDRLPIEVGQKNYIIFKRWEINISNMHAEGLFGQLSQNDTMHLTLIVPGIITSSTANLVEESRASWVYTGGEQLKRQTELIKFIAADGLLLGIEILLLGSLGIVIQFVLRLRKVNRIIEEEYGEGKTKPIDSPKDKTE